jgi:hypothetical protein
LYRLHGSGSTIDCDDQTRMVLSMHRDNVSSFSHTVIDAMGQKRSHSGAQRAQHMGPSRRCW